MFDDTIMNMIRNKALECHSEGVDSYFTKIENNIIYMYRGSLQDFYWRVVPAPDGTIYLVDINGTR